MNTYLKILAISIGIVALQHFARLLYMDQSWGNTFINSYPGPCKRVQGFVTDGSEDMTLLPSGKLIISSGLAGFADSSNSFYQGALYVLDTNKDLYTVERLQLDGIPKDVHFSPHGVHHWVHENGSVSIFLVTHQPEAVLRFLYDRKKTLKLTKTYKNSTAMRNINSVFVTGEDSFYVDNIMGSQYGHKPSMIMEYILILANGNVVYVEGDQYRVVADGVRLPNGVTGNDRYVYVATKDSINIYSILPNHGLRLYKTIPIVIGSMDNIKLDSDGNLWIGCQPNLHNVVDHLEDTSKFCYSQVLRVKDPEGEAQVESVFMDDGRFLSGVSVGLYHQRKLFVGTIHKDMAVCDVRYLIGE